MLNTKIKFLFRPWLIFKVYLVHKLRPNIWHKCEIDLAKMEAEKTIKLFRGITKKEN